MRQFAPILLITLFSFSAGAQGKYGATPEDSTDCMKYLALYGEFVKLGDYNEAVIHWRKAVKLCPKSTKNLYIHGANMHRYFIRQNQNNLKKREPLIDTLLWIYDQRIIHFGQEGYVLGLKGYAMAKYRPEQLEKARQVLARSYELEGGRSQVKVLYKYFRVLADLYVLGNNSVTAEELDSKYREFTSIIRSRVPGAKGKQLEFIEKVLKYIELRYQKVKELN